MAPATQDTKANDTGVEQRQGDPRRQRTTKAETPPGRREQLVEEVYHRPGGPVYDEQDEKTSRDAENDTTGAAEARASELQDRVAGQAVLNTVSPELAYATKDNIEYQEPNVDRALFAGAVAKDALATQASSEDVPVQPDGDALRREVQREATDDKPVDLEAKQAEADKVVEKSQEDNDA